YYIAQGLVIAGFGYSFSRLNSRIQVMKNQRFSRFLSHETQIEPDQNILKTQVSSVRVQV
ncbi:hypothetical protein, partial [uncultured Marinobacter sp.]|uniref:hypothetical protein n=1 Tax=uncultured Marinobacter sp. TaxID=187379 RepID=UPI00258D2862